MNWEEAMCTFFLGLILGMPTLQQVEDPLRQILERYERDLHEFEESLVELGPTALPALAKLAEKKAPHAPVVERVIARIKELSPALKKLVEQLGDADVDARDRATKELMKIGRAARPYLSDADKSNDKEVVLRAKFLIVALGSSSPSRRQTYVARAEAEEKNVAELKNRFQAGLAGRDDIREAELRVLRCRRRAEQIGSEEYYKAIRVLLEERVKHIGVLQEQGLAGRPDRLRAQLLVAFVDRRLGKKMDDEIIKLQLQSGEHLRGLVETGRLSETQYLAQLVELVTDPDIDLDRP